MKKKAFKMLALVFSVIMLFCSVNYGALANGFLDDLDVSDNLNATIDNPLNKIHFYYGSEEYNVIDSIEELAEATANVNSLSKSVVSSMSSENTQSGSQIELTIQFESNFTNTQMYAEFLEERSNLKTTEEVHEFRKRLNAASKEYHKSLFEENAIALDGISYKYIKHLAYSPFVILCMDSDKLTEKQLKDLAENEHTENVCIAPLSTAEASVAWDTMLEETNSYDIVQNGEYTGEGVNIGIYEAQGICDKNHDNLSDKKIFLKNSSSPIDIHATFVTSIVAHMAPDANIYAAMFSGLDDWEWFLNNECDIVNCSFAYGANDNNGDGIFDAPVGIYRIDRDGVYDYYANTHFITIVVSAGNFCDVEDNSVYNPNRAVLSPGLAYNAITVGGVKRTLSAFQYNIEYDEDAGYVSVAPVIKPEISAFMEVYVPGIGSFSSGTSWAAPQVAAVVALMMEKNSIYMTHPELVKSTLMLYARKTDDYISDRGYFDDRVGAGVLNAEDAINNNRRILWNVAPTTPSGREVITVYVTLESGDIVKAALAWNIFVSSLESTPCLTDYNLIIEGPSGVSVAYSQTEFSNVELVQYTAEASGEYIIKVILNGEVPVWNNSGDSVALTFIS